MERFLSPNSDFGLKSTHLFIAYGGKAWILGWRGFSINISSMGCLGSDSESGYQDQIMD